MQIKLTINDAVRTVTIAPGELLLETLRRLGLMSVKMGCGEGDCGACAVLVNGRPRSACLIYAASVEGSKVTTVEGLGTPTNPHALQQAFVDAGATQCGYCNPGSVIAAKALLDRNPAPTAAQVQEALDGNLCRCTGYVKRIDAVLRAARSLAKARGQSGTETDAASPGNPSAKKSKR